MHEGRNIVQVVPAGTEVPALRWREEWWRPIPETPTPASYVTGPAALNIPHAGVWAGWHTLMWHIRLVGEGEAFERANQARMGQAERWPYWDEASLRDAREGLATIGHPAAKREEPVYAATFARVVAEWVVGMAIAQGEVLAYPQPRETRDWLTTQEQRQQLKELLERAAKAQGHLEGSIRAWLVRTGI